MNKEEIRDRISEIHSLFPEEIRCEYVDLFYDVLIEGFGKNKYNVKRMKEIIEDFVEL